VPRGVEIRAWAKPGHQLNGLLLERKSGSSNDSPINGNGDK